MNVIKPQRRSYQRDVIEEELKKLHSHPTAAELYEIVRKIIPKISLGTVYRNLEQLVETGSVKKLVNGTSTRFDGNTGFHNHIRCIQCDKVTDIFDDDEERVIHGRELAGYRVTGCIIEYTGICPECQERN